MTENAFSSVGDRHLTFAIEYRSSSESNLHAVAVRSKQKIVPTPHFAES